jgi:hypothetical protein
MIGSVQSDTITGLVGNDYLFLIHKCPIHEQISGCNFSSPDPINFDPSASFLNQTTYII